MQHLGVNFGRIWGFKLAISLQGGGGRLTKNLR